MHIANSNVSVSTKTWINLNSVYCHNMAVNWVQVFAKIWINLNSVYFHNMAVNWVQIYTKFWHKPELSLLRRYFLFSTYFFFWNFMTDLTSNPPFSLKNCNKDCSHRYGVQHRCILTWNLYFHSWINVFIYYDWPLIWNECFSFFWRIVL